MKIRLRLTLWYAAILFVSLLLNGVGLYRELAEQLRHERAQMVPRRALGEAGEMVFQIGLPALVLGLAGGWWLTRKALAPVAALTEAAGKIHDHHLREQLPRSGNGDELDRLTEVFNAMTARLDGSFQRIREFTLHASHELKTPLTILRGELETTLAEPDCSPFQKERALSQIAEIERLTKIVDGLTLLTKADAGLVTLQRQPVALHELVRETYADARILAEPGGIQVCLQQCQEASILGDRSRLRQLLLNLMDNAVKYNRTGGTVAISLRRSGRLAHLSIQNTGPGLAPELQPHVFERFFRGDASHSDAVEGCGLGLSIAQWIVQAHEGTIRFDSETGKLTVVEVQLPLMAPA